MKSTRLINVNSVGWVVIFLAIILLYISYFFIYIPQQEASLNRRAFRILKEYGTSVDEKYNYYRKHVENYDIFYTFRFIIDSKWKDSFRSNIQKKLANMEIIGKVIDGLEKQVVTDTLRKDNAHFVHKNYEGKLANGYLIFESDSHYNDTIFPNKRLIHKVPIEKLMEGLKFDRLFDNIVMFDSSHVLYNYKQDFVQDITNPKAISDSTHKMQGGIIESMDVRGEKKQVMIVPFRFLDKDYFLAGFISDVAYRQKTRSIDSQLLIIIAGMLLLILAGMPVLKLIFVNHKERLHARDASWVTLSMILGVSLLVLVLLSLLKSYTVDQYIQRQRLNKVSDKLYSNFRSNLNKVLDLKDSILIPSHPDITTLAGFSNSHFVNDPEIKKIHPSLLLGNIPVNEILLIDRDGKVFNAVTRTQFIDKKNFKQNKLEKYYVPIDLSERLYFKNAIEPDSSWYDKNRKSFFYIESIKSYNTGYQETAFSFPLNKADSVRFKAPVLAITSELPSMYHQTLPPDIHYMVIDRFGDVMFHSIKSKNLHENFLDECGRNARIMGAIKHRASSLVTIAYNEKPWLARIQPVENTPLYHITLLDLAQAQNLNARIFLITFYLMLATFICTGLGMLIVKLPEKGPRFLKVSGWSLRWLFFDLKKLKVYKKMLAIQILLLISQGVGMLIISEPVTMFVYQMVCIAFSGLAALTYLGNREKPFINFFKYTHLASSLVLAILTISIVVLWMLNHNVLVLLPVLLIVLVLVFRAFSFAQKDVTTKDDRADNSVQLTGEEAAAVPHNPLNAKRMYTTYMFVWLLCLTVVPVVEYYRVVKVRETSLWHLNEMKSMADKDLKLYKEKGDLSENKWYQDILGNKIDNLTFKINDIADIDTSGNRLSYAGSIYYDLPDPVTQNYGLKELLKKENYTHEWESADSVFKFSQAGMNGSVTVKAGTPDTIGPIRWILFFLLPLLLVLIFVWKLLNFLSDSILNTISAKWVEPPANDWGSILKDEDKRHLLCFSLQPDKSLENIKTILNEPAKLRSEGNEKGRVVPIHACDLIFPDYTFDTTSSQKTDFIWITGFEEAVLQLKNHRNLLKNLNKIKENALGKLCLCIPFTIEYLDEIFEGFSEQADDNKKGDTTLISSLRKNWINLFGDFYTYTERYTPEKDYRSIETKETDQIENGEKKKTAETDIKTEGQLIAYEQQLEQRYFYIWNNLAGMEKLILFDLADDGMLNLRNKFQINNLIGKGLIKRDPYPMLFNKAFRLFIKYSVNLEETRLLENKLNKQGKWRNTQYLILLVLIPIAGFVFIAQGTSVEKVIGIFTGVLALFSGVMRLMDSSTFKHTAT